MQGTKTMPYDTLSIGPTPYDEDCEQLGPNYDPTRARLECRVFADQISRTLGPTPEHARLVITSNPHDFGTYLEVAVRYNAHDEAATRYAYRVESEAPTTWDDTSRRLLQL